MQVELCSVSLGQRLAMLTDGQIIPITNMLDCDGDDTDEPSEARAFVAGPDANGKWHEDSLDTYGFAESTPSLLN